MGSANSFKSKTQKYGTSTVAVPTLILLFLSHKKLPPTLPQEFKSVHVNPKYDRNFKYFVVAHIYSCTAMKYSTMELRADIVKQGE